MTWHDEVVRDLREIQTEQWIELTDVRMEDRMFGEHLSICTYQHSDPIVFIGTPDDWQSELSFSPKSILIDPYAGRIVQDAGSFKVPRDITEEQYFQYSTLHNFGLITYEIIVEARGFCDAHAIYHKGAK